MPSFTARIDRAAEKALLRDYRPAEVSTILGQANKEGAKAAQLVLRSRAPLGTASRLSQYYRRMGLSHGTFRKSVRAAVIRGRGSVISGLQARTVGSVIGPIGRNAFTRHWIELGTRRGMRANPWLEQAAEMALGAARTVSDAVLTRYARKGP